GGAGPAAADSGKGKKEGGKKGEKEAAPSPTP
ncbi:MAG: hypothetical protein QOI96_1058, partial [Verrucomicrobiota bacterium]